MLVLMLGCRDESLQNSPENILRITVVESNDLLLNETINLNLIENEDEVVIDENIIVYDVIKILPVDFSGYDLGSLNNSRTVLTTYEDATESVGLTFNLPMFSETTKVLVFDENNYFIREYAVETNQIEVILDEQTQTINVYKSVLNQLEADSIYYYLIQLENVYSELNSFKTLPKDAPTRFAFFGDIQGYKLSHYTSFADTYALVLENEETVDISYLAGDLVDDGIKYNQWLYFEEVLSEYIATSLWMSTIGNHDVYHSDEIYVNTFNYPSNGLEGLEERSYFIDLPFARIAVWDTESSNRFDEQAEWLKEIMNDVQKFKLVLMHRSAYPMSYNEGYIRNLNQVFDEADIDMVLSGHDHIFSRTTMKADEKADAGEGVTYMIGGSPSGSKYYVEDTSVDRYWRAFVYDEDHPVYTILDIEKDNIYTRTYAIVEGEVILIDSQTIPN